MENKKVLTIVDFVRAEDWRVDGEKLFQTYVNHLKLNAQYGFPSSCLMQYDALANPRYVAALETYPDANREIGVWIEMAREQIEKVGLPWMGRPEYNWDWHTNPDMLMAYTQDQRKLLIDELMNRFHETFGYYPSTAGSWLLDSYSMEYMAERYGVDAFLVCKEQYGTDGYTLWGGYYNQGYYPSRKNMLMPGQTVEGQIPSPVFRMLGCDPIYQYDQGRDEHYNPKQQHVVSLEPVYPESGGSETWVNWFLRTNFDAESMGFAFAQAGQENSFLWDENGVGAGITMQYRQFKTWVDRGDLEILTVGDLGRWFKKTYELTPATAVTALEDWKGQGNQSVWYDSRWYRVNWVTTEGEVCIRDIHLFNENYRERYWDVTESSPRAVYDALPVVNGFLWSGDGIRATWNLTEPGSDAAVKGTIQKAENEGYGVLCLTMNANGAEVICRCHEDHMELQFPVKRFDLLLHYHTMQETQCVSVEENRVRFAHNGMSYSVAVSGGSFTAGENWLRLTADSNQVVLHFEI